MIGYIRISRAGQNPEQQLTGVELDKLFTDTTSTKTIDRPQLRAMLTFVHAGDTVIVQSLDRLARNLDELHRLVRELAARTACSPATARPHPLATLRRCVGVNIGHAWRA